MDNTTIPLSDEYCRGRKEGYNEGVDVGFYQGKKSAITRSEAYEKALIDIGIEFECLIDNLLNKVENNDE